GVLLTGTLGSQLWQGQVQALIPSAVLLLAVALWGYARHPRTFALARLRAVADAVAEREMARTQQRTAARAQPRNRLRATSASPRPADRAAAAAKFAARNSSA